MPVPIRKVLDKPISMGLINWYKLQEKIHAALNLVDNKFHKVRDLDDNQELFMRSEDALIFHVSKDNRNYSYKLYEPRFLNGTLVCSGFEMGYGKSPNILWQPHSKVMFK